MRYLFGVITPLLLQIAVIAIIIQVNTGNGSWAGLAALLIGMFAVPATAIINLVRIRTQPNKPAATHILQGLLTAMIAPVVTVFLFLAA